MEEPVRVGVYVYKAHYEEWKKLYPHTSSQKLQYRLKDALYVGNPSNMCMALHYRLATKYLEAVWLKCEVVRTTNFTLWEPCSKHMQARQTWQSILGKVPRSIYFHPRPYAKLSVLVAAWGVGWSELIADLLEDKFLSDYECRRKRTYWSGVYERAVTKLSKIGLTASTALREFNPFMLSREMPFTDDEALLPIPYKPWRKKDGDIPSAATGTQPAGHDNSQTRGSDAPGPGSP